MPKPSEQEHKYLTTRQVEEYLHVITCPRNYKMIEKQAAALNIRTEALLLMQATYDQDKAVLVFPMFNEKKQPSGARFRRSDGKKYSLKGGQEGVFLSRTFTPSKPVIITEGPTDASAAVQVGFENVIGRPNCNGGAGVIKKLMHGHRSTPIVVITDPDDVGINGATSLAQDMSNPIVVIAGPCDLREFTTKRLKADCRRAILEGVNGDEVTTWRPVFRNMSGNFFDFVGSLKRYLQC